MTQNLTDAEIDGLSGDELTEAIGDVFYSGRWKSAAHYGQTIEYHTDLGAAFGLLLPISAVSVEWGGILIVVKHWGNEVQNGVLGDVPSTICRAYLKLVNRGA